MIDFFPISELVDRYCIAKLKLEKTGKNQIEFQFYQSGLQHVDTDLINQEIRDLYNIHKEIWNLESLLKSGLEQKIALEEIGRRAIEIRNWNNKRIKIKNKIAEILSDPVTEIKQDHISE